jgi:heme-degrading monooxygenase HmoA
MNPQPRWSVPAGSRVPADRGSDLLYQATFFRVKSLRVMLGFYLMTRRVVRQLEEGTDGLVGYSLFARPFQRRFWTLSIWRDRSSLMEFIRRDPHLEAMRRMPSRMESFEAVRWTAPRSDAPPWEEAFRRLAGRADG